MREHITHVAFDMHQDSITAAWLPPGASTPELRTIPHEPKPFRRLVKEILAHGPACACYEAGPLGYAPQRQLEAWGLPCEVIAPSLIPRRPGQRIKTDKRDAKKLAGLYRAGELTAVRVPTPEEEVGNQARPAAADHREHMTAETAEPGTATTGNATVTGTLPPAEWRVKRNLAGFEAGGRSDGTDRSLGPGYASTGSGTGRSSKRGFVASSAERKFAW